MAELPAGIAPHVYDLVWVDGVDAVSFLDGILSQELAAMRVGSVGRTFLLQPQGKLRHLLWALRGEERIGLLVDAGRGEMLVEDLGYYKIRVKVELRLDPTPVAVVWGLDEAREGWSEREGGLTAGLVGRGIGRMAVGTGADVGLPVLSKDEARAWRVMAGEPVMDVDVDESTIPQETGLVDEAVSFTKGCYLGQELVARIDSRGRVNRRLCGLRLSGGALPADGADLSAGNKVVGTLTSAVTVGDETVALGMVRREVEIGDSVAVDGIESAAVVHELPFRRTQGSHPH